MINISFLTCFKILYAVTFKALMSITLSIIPDAPTLKRPGHAMFAWLYTYSVFPNLCTWEKDTSFQGCSIFHWSSSPSKTHRWAEYIHVQIMMSPGVPRWLLRLTSGHYLRVLGLSPTSGSLLTRVCFSLFPSPHPHAISLFLSQIKYFKKMMSPKLKNMLDMKLVNEGVISSVWGFAGKL